MDKSKNANTSMDNDRVRLNLPQFDGHFEKGYIPT